jgi:D-alanyl-D-alanine carboxypeptidase
VPLRQTSLLSLVWVLASTAGATLAAVALDHHPARAEALLLIEADTGKVIEGKNAAYPWRPASVTKLMTTYVTLKALRDRRLTFDTPLTVSAKAAAEQPSKMGFPPGTQVTVDNALKMLLVHSANDIAVVLAESVSGSIADFSAEMNATAKRLGMTQTNYVNPNGLPDDRQVTSARDLAILARALIRDFPEHDGYWHIGAIRYERKIYRNGNWMLDEYPGADGMKTGFICASGYNLVATATRGDKRLIAVVLGATSSASRTAKAADMMERGFAAGNPLSWQSPSYVTVDSLTPIAAVPANLSEEICGKNRRPPGSEDDDLPETLVGRGTGSVRADARAQHPFVLSRLPNNPARAASLLAAGLSRDLPVDVYAVVPPPDPNAPSATDGTKKKPGTTAAKASTKRKSAAKTDADGGPTGTTSQSDAKPKRSVAAKPKAAPKSDPQ